MSGESLTTDPIKVLLVEDHELTRKGLAYVLQEAEDISVVSLAGNGREALQQAEQTHPDVVLMDLVMPILNGIEATQALKAQYPQMRVIVLTSHSDQDKVFSAFAAGAEGYCMKDIKMEQLLQVIRMVKDGAVWLDPAIAGYLLKVMPLISQMMRKAESREDSQVFDLTDREKEILTLIAQGLNNKEISERLSISPFTAKNHVSSIIQKLAVEDRIQAAVLALKKGLI
jgi:DNA-binding NarL/FixJ family response regulator